MHWPASSAQWPVHEQLQPAMTGIMMCNSWQADAALDLADDQQLYELLAEIPDTDAECVGQTSHCSPSACYSSPVSAAMIPPAATGYDVCAQQPHSRAAGATIVSGLSSVSLPLSSQQPPMTASAAMMPEACAIAAARDTLAASRTPPIAVEMCSPCSTYTSNSSPSEVVTGSAEAAGVGSLLHRTAAPPVLSGMCMAPTAEPTTTNLEFAQLQTAAGALLCTSALNNCGHIQCLPKQQLAAAPDHLQDTAMPVAGQLRGVQFEILATANTSCAASPPLDTPCAGRNGNTPRAIKPASTIVHGEGQLTQTPTQPGVQAQDVTRSALSALLQCSDAADPSRSVPQHKTNSFSPKRARQGSSRAQAGTASGCMADQTMVADGSKQRHVRQRRGASTQALRLSEQLTASCLSNAALQSKHESLRLEHHDLLSRLSSITERWQATVAENARLQQQVIAANRHMSDMHQHIMMLRSQVNQLNPINTAAEQQGLPVYYSRLMQQSRW